VAILIAYAEGSLYLTTSVVYAEGSSYLTTSVVYAEGSLYLTTSVVYAKALCSLRALDTLRALYIADLGGTAVYK